MTKKVTITLTEEQQEKARKASKKLFGKENISGYIGYLIEQSKHCVVGSISVDELISEGHEESYYEWYRCPKCNKNGLSDKDNYCSCCGVKILKL